MAEKKAAEFDSFADGYDSIFGGKNWVYFREKVLPYVSENPRRILDAGCGSGAVTLRFSEIGRFTIGIDISSEMISLAKRRSDEMGVENVAFVIADLEHLPFVDQAFDFTISDFAIHHTDIDLSLHELRRLASENGSVLVRDLVVNRPRLHGIALWHVFYALLLFPRLLRSKGIRRAMKIMIFELNPSWIRHKVNQQLLSPENFEDHYQRMLPGCSFPEGPIGVALWKALGRNSS